MKVTPTVSGDTSFNAIGLTILSTLEYDENGIPLRYNDKRAREIGAVRSGETVPILTKASIVGIWGQYIDTSLGAVQPGNLVVISRSGNGLLAAVDPSNTSAFATPTTVAQVTGAALVGFHYDSTYVVGKWLTSLPTSLNTGIANEWASQGGYALFQFDTNV